MSPSRPGKPCAQPGCAELVFGQTRCAAHAKKREQQRSKQRGSRPRDRRMWRDQISPAKLKANPVCELRTHCNGDRATEVHHRDGNDRNNSPANLQSACHRCHSAHTAKHQSFNRGQ